MSKMRLKNYLAVSSLALSLAIGPFSSGHKGDNLNPDFDCENDHIFKMNLDNLEDNIIQGVTFVRDKIVITAYNPNGKNTLLFIYDKEHKFVKKVELYNRCHAGGLTYDDKHDIVWITDTSGTISGYNADDIFNNDKVSPVYKKTDVSDGLDNIYGQLGCAYICYHDDKLFLGNFNDEKTSILKSYEINNDGSVNLESETKCGFIPATQGICFFDKGKDTYIVSSSSFGRLYNSSLRIMKFDDKVLDYKVERAVNMKMPSMMEQVYVTDEDILVSVYEANALKYKKANSHDSDYIEYYLGDIIEEDVKKL